MGIKRAFLYFAFGISLFSVLAVLLFVSYLEGFVVDAVDAKVEEYAVNALSKDTSNMLKLCEISHLQISQAASLRAENLKNALMADGFAGIYSETGQDYIFGDKYYTDNNGPVLKFGNSEISNTAQIKKLLRQYCVSKNCGMAIFVRTNEDGDMMNAVSVPADDYSPEKGIFRIISGRDEENAVITSLISKDAAGELIRYNNGYVYAYYVPIVSSFGGANSKTIGAIACYIKDDVMNKLCATFAAKKFGSRGYSWIIEDTGGGKFKYKLAKNPKLLGTFISDDTNSIRRKNSEEFAKNAIMLGTGEESAKVYNYDYHGKPSRMIVCYVCFKPWGWILGITGFRGEIVPSRAEIAEIISLNKWYIAAVFFGALVLGVIIACVFSSYLARNVGKINRMLKAKKGEDLQLFKSSIAEFSGIIQSLRDIGKSAQALDSAYQNGTALLEKAYSEMSKNTTHLNSLSQEQCRETAKSVKYADNIYELSETLKSSSGEFNLRSKEALKFARAHADNLRLFKERATRLKDLGAGLASRFALAREILDNLDYQLKYLSESGSGIKMLASNAKLYAGALNVKDEFSATGFSEKTQQTADFTEVLLSQMSGKISASASDMREFLLLIDKSVYALDLIIDRINLITERIALQDARFGEISRSAISQTEEAAQTIGVINELSQSVFNIKDGVASFEKFLFELGVLLKK